MFFTCVCHAQDLRPYICDVHVSIPAEAVEAHNEYYESKRWHAHGCFDEEGVVRTNGCIHFDNGAPQPKPCPDDPGKYKSI